MVLTLTAIYFIGFFIFLIAFFAYTEREHRTDWVFWVVNVTLSGVWPMLLFVYMSLFFVAFSACLITFSAIPFKIMFKQPSPPALIKQEKSVDKDFLEDLKNI